MASLTLRLVLFIFVIGIVECRMLRLNSSDDDMISDGSDHAESLHVVSSTCTHQYGFLPCADNAGGYVFQILVYQGLLVYGGNLIGQGSKVLFDIMGVGKVGGIVFRILMSLPSMILMIGSGIFSSKEGAQSMVSVGVGINAGITVFSLTFHWAICVIYGRKQLQASTNVPRMSFRKLLQENPLHLLKDTGVKIDEQTQTAAGVMLLSLIPCIILQLDAVFTTSKGSRVVTTISLIASSLSLVAYFIYQVVVLNCYESFDSKKNFISRHGQLLNEDGEVDPEYIKKLFAGVDKDGNDSVSNAEMQDLMLEIFGDPKMKIDHKSAVSLIMNTLDGDSNGRIGVEEFITGCKTLMEQTRKPSQNSESSKHIFHEIFNLFKDGKGHNPQKKELVVSKMLKHAQTKLLREKSLVTDDGKPNEEQIRALFKKFDSDQDDGISRSELENQLKTLNFGESQLKSEDILHDLFKDFDTNNDDVINEPEFIEGLKKYVNKAIKVAKGKDQTNAIDEYHEMLWKPRKYTRYDFFRCVVDILFGIGVLTFLGGPLMTNILQLSYAMKLSSFNISFVIVPLATNAPIAFEAIFPSREKTEFMASLTFSEIYGGVIMNNLSGMTALLAIVLAKDLTFDFSAEVLTVLVVCASIGALAYSRRSYPMWACALALFLYPFSLALFYFVQFFLKWN